MNTGFYEVFKGKLNMHKEKLKEELALAKSDRRKDVMKKLVKDAKGLRDLLKQMEEHMGKVTECPNCGHKLSQKD